MYMVYELRNKEEPLKIYLGVTISLKRQIDRLFSSRCNLGTNDFRSDIQRLGKNGFMIRVLETTNEPQKAFYRWLKILKPYYNRSLGV